MVQSVLGFRCGADKVTWRRLRAMMVASALMPGVVRGQPNAPLQLQLDVVSGTQGEADGAIAAIVAGKRTDLIAGLIFVLRFNRNRDAQIHEALRTLTGADRPAEWFDWMLWQRPTQRSFPTPATLISMGMVQPLPTRPFNSSENPTTCL